MGIQWKLTDFNFGGSKITADGDCSHEIKRLLLLGRTAMTNLENILKRRDIPLLTKARTVKGLVFPVVMYRCYSWTIKKGECLRIGAFELWCLSVMLISGRQLLQMEWDKGKTLTGKTQSWKGSATREVHKQRWGECWVPTGGGCCVGGAESKDGWAPNSNLRLLPQATLWAFQVPSKDTSFQADVASVITKETTLVEKRWSEQASKRQNTKGQVINISWRMNH